MLCYMGVKYSYLTSLNGFVLFIIYYCLGFSIASQTFEDQPWMHPKYEYKLLFKKS